MPYRCLAVALLLALWPWAGADAAYEKTFGNALHPGDQLTEVAGGPGGAPYILRCNKGRFLSGIHVQKVAWIDYVEPNCARVVLDDGVYRRKPGSGDQFSEQGAGNFAVDNAAAARCRDLEFIVFGLFPKRVVTPQGAFLGTFGVACRRMVAAFEQEPGSAFHDIKIQPAPQASYVPLGAISCPNGYWAVGIHGGAGLYVDAMGLICGQAPDQPLVGVEDLPNDAPIAITPKIGAIGGAFKKEESQILVTPQDKLSSVLAMPKALASQVFENPTVNGVAVDVCLVWGQSCGEPAASAFCQSQGFARAVAHTVQNDAPPTLVLSDGAICNYPVCDRFSSVTCTR